MSDRIEIPAIDHLEIDDRRKAEAPDAKDVVEYRDYLIGHHPEMTDLKQSALLGKRDARSSTNNLLKLVVQTTASRLKLESWEIDTDDDDDAKDLTTNSAEKLKDFLDETWRMNQMSRLQYRTVVATLRDGNTAIMFGWRDGRIKYWLEPWWDGTSGLFLFYKSDDTYDYAVKDFKLRIDRKRTVERRNVYTEGMISRFYKKGNGWVEWTEEGEAYSPLIGPGNKPLALPLVHFQNDSNGIDHRYGESEVASLLSLQDDLNALQADISAVALLTAFQRIFVSGASIPAGDIKISPGGIIGVPGDANLSSIEAGNSQSILAINEMKQQTLATGSRTPMHSITGVWPSGAALLQADLPQIDKVEMLGDLMGPRYTMLAHRSTEYANAYGNLDLDENIPIISAFAPSQRIDEITELDIKKKKADLWTVLSKLPLEAMIKAGVDPATAKSIVDARAQEAVVADFGL